MMQYMIQMSILHVTNSSKVQRLNYGIKRTGMADTRDAIAMFKAMFKAPLPI